MNKYKVKYTLNEKLHWTNVLAEDENSAAKQAYREITEAYPDDDYEYMDVELDVDDDEVTEGASFITDGYEYKWIGRMGDSVYLDFDHWAVWAAENQDTNEIQFFIVEEDTGFIDWGPVDTAKEATEFLQGKIDEYNQEESLVENSDDNKYNTNKGIKLEDYVNQQLKNEEFKKELERLCREEKNFTEDLNRTFIETEEFKKDWDRLNLTEDDLQELQNNIIEEKGLTPLGGQVYKIRFSPKSLNKGKNTSDRVIFADIVKQDQIFLLKVFSKSEEANISNIELKILKQAANILGGNKQ